MNKAPGGGELALLGVCFTHSRAGTVPCGTTHTHYSQATQPLSVTVTRPLPALAWLAAPLCSTLHVAASKPPRFGNTNRLAPERMEGLERPAVGANSVDYSRNGQPSTAPLTLQQRWRRFEVAFEEWKGQMLYR